MEDAPRLKSEADWSFNVNDAASLREFSTAVVSGKVIGVERSFVDGDGFVATAYSVQVETVYKGANIADVISITLPGGTVTLGEYITTLDSMGRYQEKLGTKSPENLREHGVDPKSMEDPRTMNPSTPVSENWGLNPASPSMVAELQPDFLGVLHQHR